METGKSGAYFNPKERMEASRNLFGTDINSIDAKDFEKYGLLMDKDIIRESQESAAVNAWFYGRIAVRFKKDKVVATFTMDDSLNDKPIPSLTTDPRLTSFQSMDILFRNLNKANQYTKSHIDFWDQGYIDSYVELQFHGHLGVDAIESIFIPSYLLNQIDMDILRKYSGSIKFYTEENGVLKLLF